MSRKLVAYFSASGVTARVAKALAQAADADLYEIVPQKRYSESDLDWRNNKSRSSVEMNDPASRPAVAGKAERMEDYDTLLVGFPIWWYTAPTIIRTFLEAYDLRGKKLAFFATSGGSGMGDTAKELASSCPGAVILGGRLLNGRLDADALRTWAESL